MGELRADSAWSYRGSCARARGGGRGPGRPVSVAPAKKTGDGGRLLGGLGGLIQRGGCVVRQSWCHRSARPEGPFADRLEWAAGTPTTAVERAAARGPGRGAGVFFSLFLLCPHALPLDGGEAEQAEA